MSISFVCAFLGGVGLTIAVFLFLANRRLNRWPAVVVDMLSDETADRRAEAIAVISARYCWCGLSCVNHPEDHLPLTGVARILRQAPPPGGGGLRVLPPTGLGFTTKDMQAAREARAKKS